ncbi:GPO family capsid scaffolding protein [Shewanella sp. D64]|uniref:GPO family capsid scaffolding protein n=1 Tax=unclassified Shewanella TaxID=196818 RepID=UPI0022BA423D|nr:MULTISPECIES: GPO family capsid scaffolding protein [unclassified Shewanella]MEC4725844.1 GPO family capsid scaffolding protein [Shewanella sp. D64]MEC4737099.1 GPO family capsid scaffolding protein [Shewanella sp. E94]WBJ95709.1 GPO family capsid scaffolding protein [Shewanella sp. MTB7]
MSAEINMIILGKNNHRDHAHMAKLLTDWICVCTSGLTADKRMVEPQLLLDAVAAYSPDVYEARIYPVHLYEWSYDRVPVGDIVELKAETATDGVVSVYAKLRPYSDMVRLNERQQLCYVSLEIDAEFAGSSKAYIKGASLTDAPACLGLDRIQLSDNLNNQQQKLLITSHEIQLSALATQHEGVFSRMAHAIKQLSTDPQRQPIKVDETMPDLETQNELNQLNTKLDSVLTQLSTLTSTEAVIASATLTAPDELALLQAKITVLETENTQLKQGEDALQQLTTKLEALDAKLLQLSGVPPGQTPNPAGLTAVDKYEDVV